MLFAAMSWIKKIIFLSKKSITKLELFVKIRLNYTTCKKLEKFIEYYNILSVCSIGTY